MEQTNADFIAEWRAKLESDEFGGEDFGDVRTPFSEALDRLETADAKIAELVNREPVMSKSVAKRILGGHPEPSVPVAKLERVIEAFDSDGGSDRDAMIALSEAVERLIDEARAADQPASAPEEK